MFYISSCNEIGHKTQQLTAHTELEDC